MKKFSRIATAGLVFAAGLSLAACHPPNQQDSTSEKIDNASTYTGTAPDHAEHSSSAVTPTAIPGTAGELGIESPYATQEGQTALETGVAGVSATSMAPAQ
ncbi:hypothetical protein ACWIB8_08260 [Corynebacterium flavescens]